MEFLIVAVIVAVVGFGIYYIVQDAKERGDEWKEKEFSFGGRLLLLLNVLLTFAGAAATAYLFMGMDEPTWGVVGLFIWVICSIVSAHVTSPIRVFIVPNNTNGADGCAYMLYLPLMMIVMLVSVALVMLISWIYALMAIFRGAKKWGTAIVLILLAGLVASPFVVQGVKQHQAVLEAQRLEQEAEAKKEREKQLTASIVEKVKAGLQSGRAEELELTEEENSFVNSTTLHAFALKETRKEVASVLSDLYYNDDVAGILKLTGFLAANSALSHAGNDKGVNICFTSSFVKLIWEEVTANGSFREESTDCDVYIYQDYEVWIDREKNFIAVYANINGARMSVMYSNSIHMNELIETYGEEKLDYYRVGYMAEYVTVNTSGTGTSTTTKKGNCSRCSGTGKVTKHYGNSWNSKPGYQYGKTCGACNGTGWVK